MYTVSIKNIKQLNYAIYNRWGNKIKEGDFTNLTTAYQTLPLWDGTYNETECSDGVYYYLINYSSFTNKQISTKGFITLLR